MSSLLYKDIVKAVYSLNAIDDYIEMCNKSLCDQEWKLLDLYHTIERFDLTDAQGRRVLKELKKVLIERRRLKNEIHLGTIYNNHKGRLAGNSGRDIIIQATNACLGRQDVAEYKYRYYTNKQLNKILGAKILPVESEDNNGEEKTDGENQNM